MRDLQKVSLFVVLCLFPMSFTSCGGDDDVKKPEIPIEAKTVSFVANSTKPAEWVYFSFTKGAVVEVDKSNPEADQSWDIAFQRFYIRTNSGTSGKGKGGALDTKELSFDAVKTVPSTGFIVDSKATIMASMGKNIESSVNTAFQTPGNDSNSWAWFYYQEMRWVYNKNVFLIRTADGKTYAKIIMESYKNAEGDSGHITFSYIYPFK